MTAEPVPGQGESEPFHSPAFKSAVEVDPTGAGDVFAGAFLWHLYKGGGDWKAAADWANSSSAG